MASSPSCATDPKLTAAASSAYHVDGGGWRLVRRAAPSNNAWHPATDSLLGTASYGTATIDETADSTFSIPFSADASTEFLFATGDAQKWLIATGAQIGGAFTDDYYSNSNRDFQLSSDGVRGMNAVVFGHDDIDLTGTQALNAGDSTWNFAQNQGFGLVLKMKWTAAANYEGFFSFKSTSNSHKVELVRLGTSSSLYVHWYDANGVACNSPPVNNNHGIYTPSNTWFTLKFFYDHSSKQFCHWVDTTELCHTCPSNFGALTDTVMESWLGATSQTNSFSGEIAGVYTFTGPLTAEEQTIVADRIVVDAPDSVTSARWYNRAHVYNPEDPWISINDHMSSPNLMLYGENNVEVHSDFVMEHNGANVFVRTTYIYPEASFVFNPADTAEETFDGSRGDIETSVSVPVTTDSDGWTIIFKIRYDSSAATWDAVFDLNSDANNLGNIYATISTTNTLRILVRNPGSSTTLCSLNSAAIFVTDVSHAVIISFSTESETLSMKIGNNAEVTTSCAGFVSRTYTALSIGTARQWNNAEWNGEIFGLYFFDSLVESNRAQELVSQIVEGGKEEFSFSCPCPENTYQSNIDVAVTAASQFFFSGSLTDYVNGQTIEKVAGTEAYVSDSTYGDVLDLNQGSFNIVSDSLSALLNADAWTVSLWFKPTVSAKNSMLFYRLDITGGVFGTAAYIYTDNRVWIDRYTQSSAPKALKSQILTIGTWYHLVFVSTPTKIELHVDNALSTATGSVSTTESWGTVLLTEKKIGIGAKCRDDTDPDCTDHDRHGHLHDMRFYNHALSVSEISLIHNDQDESRKACVSCPANSKSSPGSTSLSDCTALSCEDGVSVSYWSIRKSTCP